MAVKLSSVREELSDHIQSEVLQARGNCSGHHLARGDARALWEEARLHQRRTLRTAPALSKFWRLERKLSLN